MSITEIAVSIADKIYWARRSLKRFLEPTVYAEQVKDWQEVIQLTMERQKLGTIPAATHILKQLKRQPEDTAIAQMWVLAAVAEMLEPEP